MKKKKTEYKGEKTELREERRRAFSKEDIKGTERGGAGVRQRAMEGNREREKEGGMREEERQIKRKRGGEGGGGGEKQRQRTKEKDREERKTERGKGEGGIATRDSKTTE